MKEFLKCHAMMTLQREMYWIFRIIKIMINLLRLIYQDTQIQVPSNKLKRSW